MQTREMFDAAGEGRDERWMREAVGAAREAALRGEVPVGACVMSDRVASQIRENDLGTTFGGGMMAMAAVVATLEAIEDERMLENAKEFEVALRRAFADVPSVVSIHGKGCLLGIEFDRPAAQIHKKLLDANIIAGTSSAPNVLRLLPPLCTDLTAVETLKRVIVSDERGVRSGE